MGQNPRKKNPPPAPEDKPFPGVYSARISAPPLEKALKEEGISDVQLSFEQQPLGGILALKTALPTGMSRVSGSRGARQFNIAFTKDDIKSPKVFLFGR